MGSPWDTGCQGAPKWGQRRGQLHLHHPAGTAHGQWGIADVPCTLPGSNGPANTTNTSNTRVLGTPLSLDGQRGALCPWLFNPKLTSGWRSSCHPPYFSGGRMAPMGWLWPRLLSLPAWQRVVPVTMPGCALCPPGWQGLPGQGVRAGPFMDTAAQLKPSQRCHVPAEPGCRPGVRCGRHGGTGGRWSACGEPPGSCSQRGPGAAVPLWSPCFCRAWGPSRGAPGASKGTGPCWGTLEGYITPSPPTKVPGMVLAQWVGDPTAPLITGGLGENCPMASQTAPGQGGGSGKTPSETGAEGQHPLGHSDTPLATTPCPQELRLPWGGWWGWGVSPPRVGDVIIFFLVNFIFLLNHR